MIAIVSGIEVFNGLDMGLRVPCPNCGTVFRRIVGINEATGEKKLICSGCSTAYFTTDELPGLKLHHERAI